MSTNPFFVIWIICKIMCAQQTEKRRESTHLSPLFPPLVTNRCVAWNCDAFELTSSPILNLSQDEWFFHYEVSFREAAGATVASKQQSHWGKRQKSTLLFSRAQLMDRRTPKRNRSASWGLRDADRLRRPSLCLVKVSFCEGDNIGGLTMRLVSATPFHLLHIVGWKQVAHAQKWRRAGQLPRVNFSSDYCRHSRGMWSPYLSVPYGSSLQKLFERNLRKARPSSWKRCEPFFFFFPSK